MAAPRLWLLVLSGLTAVPGALAAQPVVDWEHRLEGQVAPATAYPIAMRVLADGSTLILSSQNGGTAAVRYARGGSVLSSTILPVSYSFLAAIDPFGAVFVTRQIVRYGPLYDFWTMKYDGTTGKELWPNPRIFDGPDTSGRVDSREAPTAIAVAPNGDVVVAGWTREETGRSRWVVLRYGATKGALRWGPVYPGDGSRIGNPYSIAFDAAGDILVSGADIRLTGSGAEAGWAIVKYGGFSGTLLWKTEPVGVPEIPMVCPGSCFTPYVAKLAVDRAGNVVLAASSFASTTSANGNYQEWLTVKYDGASGAKIWGPLAANGQVSGYYEAPRDVAVDTEGGVLVTGTLATASGIERAIIKYEGATGRVAWGPVFLGAFGLVGGSGFVLDGFGNPILAGISTPYPTSESREWVGLKLSGRSGSPLWLRAIAAAEGGGPVLMSLSGGGRVVVAGNSSGYRMRTLSFASSDGGLAWGPSVFAGITRSSNFPVAVASDSEGNTLVVAQDSDSSGNVQPVGVTLKLDRNSGRPSWGPVRFSEAPSSLPRAMAVDRDDDVFVTGYSYSSSGTGYDWETVKYNGATGSLLWGPATMDRGGNWDSPSGLALDVEGNAIVVGKIEALNLVTWALVKYDGDSGAVRWGPAVYDPPLFDTRRQSEAMRALVDRNGDVFVTAWTRITLDRAIWVTGKYDGDTGASIWGPLTHDAPLSGGGFPMDAALDRNGDVIVSGVSGPGWMTIKYSGATGTVLWEQVRRIVNSGRPRQVVVDSNGDAVVVGERSNSGSGYVVIKYGGSTGTALWEAVSNAESLNDTKNLVSLDPAGNPIVLSVSSNGLDADWTTTKYSGATGQVVWGPLVYDGGVEERPVALASAGPDFVVVASQSAKTLTVRFSESLGVRTADHEVGRGYCGEAYGQSLTAGNGTPPYSWALIEGVLPRGLVLRPSGEIVGEPRQEGAFPFTVRLTDSAGNAASRGFQLEVLEGGERPAIGVASVPICPSGYRLSLAGSFSLYEWLPNGERTPTIDVCPEQRTLFGVVATDERGCTHRASVELDPKPAPARQPVIRPTRSRPPTVPRTR
jgi:hypothetical protein